LKKFRSFMFSFNCCFCFCFFLSKSNQINHSFNLLNSSA
jgi:hypothetical protein